MLISLVKSQNSWKFQRYFCSSLLTNFWCRLNHDSVGFIALFFASFPCSLWSLLHLSKAYWETNHSHDFNHSHRCNYLQSNLFHIKGLISCRVYGLQCLSGTHHSKSNFIQDIYLGLNFLHSQSQHYKATHLMHFRSFLQQLMNYSL